MRILLLAIILLSRIAGAQPDPDAFSGSFRLETGEVVTGGYFVEDATDRFIYMDTDALEKAGLFERTGDLSLRSVFPEGITIEFEVRDDGVVEGLHWRQDGSADVYGPRVFGHTTRPIEFRSEDGTMLHGDLLIPDCAGPHPLIVSGHGSGPVNRYAGPFQTFFLQQGMAVLRYDKRGFTTDAAQWAEPDLIQLAEDATAAVRFAAGRPEIDAGRIGLFGSSQGGWVAPVAAVAASETRFMIVRSGPGVNDNETYLHQRRQELRTTPLDGLDLDHAIALHAEIQRLAMLGAPIEATDDLVTPYLETDWYRAAFGDERISARWSARWWRWMQRNFDLEPGPYLERFDGPVLWFLGEDDENVPLVSSRAALDRAFATSTGTDHEIVMLAGANHSFLVYPEDGQPHYTHGFWNRMRDWLAVRGFADSQCY